MTILSPSGAEYSALELLALVLVFLVTFQLARFLILAAVYPIERWRFRRRHGAPPVICNLADVFDFLVVREWIRPPRFWRSTDNDPGVPPIKSPEDWKTRAYALLERLGP